MRVLIFTITFLLGFTSMEAQKKRARDFGLEIGVLETGEMNSITDVSGVSVGHTTIIEGEAIRTGVTAILPHSGNIFQDKVPAAIYLGNGFGKLAGYSQVKELGNIETPIILTNTLSVPVASDALISYTLDQEGNERVRSVNSVVGETNDGYLNDIRGRHVSEDHVLGAIANASQGPVVEGNVGAGTGTTCFGYKGGIGSASRLLPKRSGGYTVGVLAQTNFGGILTVNGVPIAKELETYSGMLKYDADGSCMMIVATDAPLDARNLERLAKRAMLGLGRSGGIASNGSGDYVIAFSTASENFVSYSTQERLEKNSFLRNDLLSPLFAAVIEATEEAIINSLFAAEDMKGHDGRERKAMPIDKVLKICREHNILEE